MISPNPATQILDNRPIPDPTSLTTEQLLRETASLKEIIFTRLEGMDKAIVVFQENLTRAPTEVDKQISHLKELLLERFSTSEVKFESIQIQFRERDTRTEQTSKDSKVAVDAALQAAKEAVSEQNKSSALAIGKSEASTTKQIDQIGQLINNTNAATNDKIDDIKTRLTALESRSQARTESSAVHTSSNQWIVALLVGAFVSFMGLGVTLLLAFWKH